MIYYKSNFDIYADHIQNVKFRKILRWKYTTNTLVFYHVDKSLLINRQIKFQVVYQ